LVGKKTNLGGGVFGKRNKDAKFKTEKACIGELASREKKNLTCRRKQLKRGKQRGRNRKKRNRAGRF